MREDDLDSYVDLVLHELSSPLSALQLWTSILRRGTDDPALREKTIDAIERSATQQAQLVRDLRDLALVMRGEVQGDTDEIVLSRVLDTAIDSVRADAIERGCEIDARIVPDVRIRGDADKLGRVFTRVLEQLLRVRSHGGTLRIDLVVEDEAVACTMSRAPAEAVAKVSFTQVFARAMVQLHAGTLDVRDATWRVRLPR